MLAAAKSWCSIWHDRAMRLRTVLFVLSLAGCKHESVDDAIAKLPAGTAEKLDRAVEIGKRAASAELAKHYAGGRLEPVHFDRNDKPSGNVVLAYATDLPAIDDPVKAPRVPVRVLNAQSVSECWWAVKKRAYAGYALSDGLLGPWQTLGALQPFQVGLLCRDLAAAQKLVVITVGATESAGVGVAPTPTSDQHFDAGKATGSLLVWDLATGTYEGALPYVGESSGFIGYSAPGSGMVDRQMAASKHVESDLRDRTQDAIEHALAGSGKP
jgi:hypothetical protein